MQKGILLTILFYGIGFGLAGLIYLIVGNPYIHAPGLHHLIMFLTWVIGLIWTLISLRKYVFKKKTKQLSGILLTNAVVILGCILYVFIPIHLDSTQETIIESNFIRTETEGDSTKIYHNNNLIYIKVKDSVILDLRSD